MAKEQYKAHLLQSKVTTVVRTKHYEQVALGVKNEMRYVFAYT